MMGALVVVWAAFVGLGMSTAIVATGATFGDVDAAGTLADWASVALLLLAGVTLLRRHRWSGMISLAVGLALLAFGLYWTATGRWSSAPGAPFPNVLTESALPPAFFLAPVVPLLIGAFAAARRRACP